MGTGAIPGCWRNQNMNTGAMPTWTMTQSKNPQDTWTRAQSTWGQNGCQKWPFCARRPPENIV
eukprot:10433765-Lingulodinium_polyedra.AAC.1